MMALGSVASRSLLLLLLLLKLSFWNTDVCLAFPSAEERSPTRQGRAVDDHVFNSCLADIGRRALGVGSVDVLRSWDGGFHKTLMEEEPCVPRVLDKMREPSSRRGRQEEPADLQCLFCPAERPEELYKNFAKCFTGSDVMCCSCILFTSINISIAYFALTG